LIKVYQANTKELIESARELFLKYASSLNFDLCFQGFDKELESLPGEYSPPDGRLMLAEIRTGIAGCIALRKLDTGICEMKRLYVKHEYRNYGLGRTLTEVLISEAKFIGYKKMRLDTIPIMKEAIKLYRSLGFIEIEPYRYNPIEGALYMELDL
jgi:ribosomal protein S18 acetylase RimI-like enzyme